MSLHPLLRTLVISSALVFSTSDLLAAIALVKNGTPEAVIVVSNEETKTPATPAKKDKAPISTDLDSAKELIATIQKISGAELPLRPTTPADLAKAVETIRSEGKRPVIVGALARDERLTPEARTAFEDPAAFLLHVTPDEITVAGATPDATRFAVYELLEQLGVRWFLPGEIGTVIPSGKTVSLEEGSTLQRPSFIGRQLQYPKESDWLRHLRMGGPVFPNTTGIPLGKGVNFETHPELYALVNGVRRAPHLCLSNPEVLRLATESMRAYFRANPEAEFIGLGPGDHNGFCECAGCRALDSGLLDPINGQPIITDRYLGFFNQLLDATQEEFPTKKIALAAYNSFLAPPTKVKPNPRIAIGIVPAVSLCRFHGIDNPICPERNYFKDLVTQWREVLPEVHERGGWFKTAEPGTLFIQTQQLRDEIPFLASQGIRSVRRSLSGNWATEGPSAYIAAKLLWNAKADPEEILRDFCEKLFGPAATPMRQYFEAADKAISKSDHHGTGIFSLLKFYPPATRTKLQGYLAQAAKAAIKSPYKERVALFADGFADTDTLARLLEARNKGDWKAADARMKEFDAIRERLVKAGYKNTTEGYFRHFLRPSIEQAVARTSGGNELVAPLAEKWEFLIDPRNNGEKFRFEQPGTLGGNWQPFSSWASTWSDQGLRYYKGYAWYRQSVEIPKKFAGKKIVLWSGGVDENADIWVNGKKLDVTVPKAFAPFEADATDAIRPGEKNTIVIRIANLETNDLGTGGLVSPLFFYAPAQ